MANPVWYVAVLWILWILQFVLFRPKEKQTSVQTAPNARWGIALQTLGYWAIFIPAAKTWPEPVAAWRLVVGVAFGALGIWLASAGIRHLGKQWRVNAALNADHQLITSGPYQIVRHPIYASMFAMNIMSALMLGETPLVADRSRAFRGGNRSPCAGGGWSAEGPFRFAIRRVEKSGSCLSSTLALRCRAVLSVDSRSATEPKRFGLV